MTRAAILHDLVKFRQQRRADAIGQSFRTHRARDVERCIPNFAWMKFELRHASFGVNARQDSILLTAA